MAIYKYFTQESHAVALIRRGELLFRSLSYFRSYEEDGVRGDPLDGVLAHAPDEGLVLNMQDGREIKLSDSRFHSSAKDEIFRLLL